MTVRSTCADSRALPDARRYCPRVLFGDDFSFMAGDSIPRCILLIVLIFAVGVFSYCNRTRMKTLAGEGSAAAKRVAEILAKYDKNIVTLLIIINIIYVTAAAVSTVLAIGLSGPAGSVVAMVVLTLFVFPISETIHKNVRVKKRKTHWSLILISAAGTNLHAIR